MKFFRLLLLVLAVGFISGCGNKPEEKASLEGSIRVEITSEESEEEFDLEGIQVFLPGTPWNALTDRDGKFWIPGIEPGKYELVVKHPDFETYRRENLQIVSGRKTSLLPITLIPMVSEMENGKVLGVVELEDSDSSGQVQIGVDKTPIAVFSQPDGSFTFSNFPPGEYTLTFSKPGYKSVENIPVTVEANQVVNLPKVFLEKGSAQFLSSQGIVKGKVWLEGSTTLLEGTLVSFENTNIVSMTNSKGEFIFNDVPEGSYTLLVVRQGYKPGKISPIKVTNEKIQELPDIVLQPLTFEGVNPGSILGTVQVFDKEDNRGIIIELIDTPISTVSDFAGVYLLEGVPEGVYAIKFSLPGYETRILGGIKVNPGLQTIASSILLDKPVAPEEKEGFVYGLVTLSGKDDHSGITVALAGTSAVGITDAQGTYKLKGVDPGVYELLATKSGYEDGSAKLKVISGGSTVAPSIVLKKTQNPPQVISTSPSDGESEVPVTEKVVAKVQFDRFMDRKTMKEGIKIDPQIDMKIGFGKDEGSSDYDTLELVFPRSGKSPVKFDTLYQITIPGTVADLDGNQMKEPYRFSFTTGGPRIVKVMPSEGTKDYIPSQVGRQVQIFFNTQVDMRQFAKALSIKPGVDYNPIPFRIKQKMGDIVELEVGLKEDTRYTITIDKRLTTPQGEKFDNTPYSWSFRTGSIDSLPQYDIDGEVDTSDNY